MPALWLIGEEKQKRMSSIINIVLLRKGEPMINKVTVRWWDGYLETFEATEVRFGCDLLWMRLANGKNRHIPLRMVRWFGMSEVSHEPERRTDEMQ